MRVKTLLPALALLAAPAPADTIHLTDGKAIEDVDVDQETLQEVTYRSGSKRESVPSAKVLSIDYSGMPQLVDRARLAASEGAFADAATDLRTYVDGFLAGNKRERYQWAPAHAARRLIELNRMIGGADGVIEAADRLIESFPESRHVPAAYLARAEAQAAKGSADQAQRTLQQLEELVLSKSLSPRWRLEAQLAKVLYDPALKAAQKREALIRVSSEAGSEFPTVRNAADVAEAEVLLASKQVEDAERIFRRVIDDPKAGSATLAAAYTGLGDVLYQRAAAKGGDEAKPIFRQALLAYMRVVVNHEDQIGYVPKALFYAGRSFDQIGDEGARDSARKLYIAVVRDYPGSSWATEARGFLK